MTARGDVKTPRLQEVDEVLVVDAVFPQKHGLRGVAVEDEVVDVRKLAGERWRRDGAAAEREVRRAASGCPAFREFVRQLPAVRAHLPDGDREEHEGDAVEHGVRQGHTEAREPDRDERYGDGRERPRQRDFLRMHGADEPVQPDGEVRVIEPADERDAGEDRGARAKTPQGRAEAEKEDERQGEHRAERGGHVSEGRLPEVGRVE